MSRSTYSVPMADMIADELRRLRFASSWAADDDLMFADPTRAGRSTRQRSKTFSPNSPAE
jgi:hypothetical protein